MPAGTGIRRLSPAPALKQFGQAKAPAPPGAVPAARAVVGQALSPARECGAAGLSSWLQIFPHPIERAAPAILRFGCIREREHMAAGSVGVHVRVEGLAV